MRKIKMAGIYKIEHSSGKYYIGMSVDIFGRWSNHYCDIKTGRHSSVELVELWLKTKPEEWSFSVLEYVSITDFRTSSGLKGKALDTAFRRHLLLRERVIMSGYSVNGALNKDVKYFS